MDVIGLIIFAITIIVVILIFFTSVVMVLFTIVVKYYLNHLLPYANDTMKAGRERISETNDYSTFTIDSIDALHSSYIYDILKTIESANSKLSFTMMYSATISLILILFTLLEVVF